jgi:hypothetical protein
MFVFRKEPEMATKLIGETEYKYECDITGGDGLHDLAVTSINAPDRGNTNPRFVVMSGEKEFVLWPTEFYDTNFWKDRRTRWFMKGYVLNHEFATNIEEKDGQFYRTAQTRFASAELSYNMITKQGRLRILAHEQPKPALESLSWGEALNLVDQNYREGAVETRSRQKLETHRGRIRSARFLQHNLILQIEVQLILKHNGRIWIPVLGDTIEAPCEGGCQPLRFADGRILIALPNVDINIYPKGVIQF